MRKNILNSFGCALMVSGLLLAAAPARAQMMGGASPGAQNSNTPQNNGTGQQNNGMMGAQNNGQSGPEQSLMANVRRNTGVETELSKMALKNSSTPELKAFAQQVITDNRKLQNQVSRASSMNSPMGTSFPLPVPQETRKAEKQMKKLTGQQFDKIYLVQMDAYIKNDQQVAQSGSSITGSPDASALAMQLRTISGDRAKQIAQLTKQENMTIK